MRGPALQKALDALQPDVRARLEPLLISLQSQGTLPHSTPGLQRLIRQLSGPGGARPNQFQRPTLRDPKMPVAPVYQVPADVLQQQGRYVQMLEKSLNGHFRSVGQGSQMVFESTTGRRFNMPNFGTVLNSKTGLPVGHSVVSNLLNLGPGGSPTAVGVHDWMAQRLGANASPAGVRDLNRQLSQVTRFVGNNDRRGMTPIDSFHDRRFIVAPGQTVGSQGFNDLMRLSGKSETIASMVQKVTRDGLNGLPLYLDPLTETAGFSGVFSSMRASDFSWLGGLYKGNYKFGQAFRTLPVNVTPGLKENAAADYKKLGFRNAGSTRSMYHGRWVNTSEMWDRGKDMVQGVNLPTQVMFGEKAARFPDINNVFFTDRAHKAVVRDVAWPGGRRPKNGAIGLHGTEKGMFAGIEKIAGAGARRPGKMRDLSSFVDLMTGGTIQTMLDRGKSEKQIARALRHAAGMGKVVDGHLVLDNVVGTTAGRLFDVDGSLPLGEQIGQQVSNVSKFLGRLSKHTGITSDDFVKRKNGLIVSARVNQMFGVRDVSSAEWKESLRDGMNMKRGLRMNNVLIAEARLMGNTELAEYYSNALRDPEMQGHLRNTLRMGATTQHLLDQNSGPAKDIKGAALTSLGTYDVGKREAMGRMREEVATRMAANKVGGAPTHAGVASIMEKYNKSHGLYDEIMTGSGMTVGLGANHTVAGRTHIGGVAMDYAGSIDRVSLGNVSLMGGDRYAWHSMQFLERGVAARSSVKYLTEAAMKQGVGGAKTIHHMLANARLGSTMTGMIQNSDSPAAWATLLGEQAEREALIKHGATNPARVAKIRKLMEGGEYAFAHTSQFEKLSAEAKKFHAKHGYVPVMGARDPHTGRPPPMLRMSFTDRVARGSGIHMRTGPAGLMSGDADFDWFKGLVMTDKGLLGAFRQGEKNQHSLLSVQQRLSDIKSQHEHWGNQQAVSGMDKVARAGGLPGDVTEASLLALRNSAGKPLLSAQEAKHTYKMVAHGVPGSLKEKGGQAAARAAGENVKTITPLVSPLVMHQQEVMDALHKHAAGGITAEQYQVLSEMTPARVEMAISKHSLGTNTLDMLKDMNTMMKKQGTHGVEAAASFDNVFLKSFEKFTEGSPGFLFKHGQDVLGMSTESMLKTYESGGPEGIESMLKTGMKSEQYGAFRAASMGLLGRVSAVNDDIELLGRSDKKFFTPEAVRGQLAKRLGGGGLDDIAAATAALLGHQQVELAEVGVRAAPAAAKAAVAAGDGTLWGAARAGLSGAASNFVKNHPVATVGVGALALAGTAAYGVSRLMGGARTVRDHIAARNEQDTVPPPQTQYVMSPWDEAGVSMSMQASGPPSVMRMGPGMVNQLQGPTDVRIIDSRMGVSDRVLAGRAQDRLTSLYG